MSDVLERKATAANWTEFGELEVLTFNLSGETFALEAAIVQEILDPLPETRVPGSPAFAGSVINFRGKVIPLADIRIAFGMTADEATADSRIVVTEIDIQGEPTLIGLRTDKVNEVTTLAEADAETPPSVGMRWRQDYISCLVKRGGEFIILPNLQTIFAN